MSLFSIAWKRIRQRLLSSSLTALSVALGVMLMVGVLVIYGVIARMFSQNSIGYDLNAEDGGANQCMSSFFWPEWPRISAYAALQDISSGDDYFYNKPNPGQLNTIYTNVAVKVLGPRLVE